MANIIISIIISVLSFSFFTVTYRVNGINRTIYNIPIAIFESSIPLVQEKEQPTIYFDKISVELKLTSYFVSNIRKYCDKFTVKFYYYNQEDYSYCSASTCDAVEIHLSADVLINYQYHRVARFYIEDNR